MPESANGPTGPIAAGDSRGDPWPLEKARFIAANRQAHRGGNSFRVARASGARVARRLLGYGRRNTTSELEEPHRQLNMPVVNAIIDSGFKASEVYRFCLPPAAKR